MFAAVDVIVNASNTLYLQVGIVYVGKGQCNDEAAILGNTYGSQRYSNFLKKLGTLLNLKVCEPKEMYIGGLDHGPEQADGKYTYAWHDEVVQSKLITVRLLSV